MFVSRCSIQMSPTHGQVLMGERQTKHYRKILKLLSYYKIAVDIKFNLQKEKRKKKKIFLCSNTFFLSITVNYSIQFKNVQHFHF